MVYDVATNRKRGSGYSSEAARHRHASRIHTTENPRGAVASDITWPPTGSRDPALSRRFRPKSRQS